MAEPQAVAPSTRPDVETAREQGITLRSVTLGIATVVAVNLWVTYSETIVRSTRLNLSTFQLTLLAIFIVLVAVVNPLLKRFGQRFALSPSELLVIVAIGIVGSVVPTSGITGFFISIISAPFYFDSPENQWEEYYHPHLNDWTVPTDREALRVFYEGLPPGMAAPWEAWVIPLLWWTSLIASVFVASACVMVILRRQWAEHEKLAYPLAEVPLEMARDARSSRLLPEFMRGKLFWIAALFAFSLLFWKSLSWFSPAVPDIRSIPNGGIFRFTRYSPFVIVKPFQFFTMGFAYFANLQVLFSVWFFFLVHVVEGGIKNRLGYRIGWATDSFGADPPTEAWQCHGALAFFVVWRFWVARRHLKDVLMKAIRPGYPVDDSGEMLSYRTAVVGLLLSLAYAMFWLHRVGMDMTTVLMFVFATSVIYVGMARLAAEAGVPYAQSTVTAQAFVMDLRGTDVLSRATMTTILLSYSLIDYMRGLFTPGLAHVAKWGDTVRGNRRRLLLFVGLGVLAGLLTSVIATIHFGHLYGGYHFRWFGGNPKGVFSSTLGMMKSPRPPDTVRLLFYGIGAGLMGLLTFLRYRFSWWPVHPIGLTLAAADNNAGLVMPVFFTWVIKSILMRIGGVNLYRRAKPVFLGLLVGHTAGVVWCFVLDAIWFPGHGHQVHEW